MQIHVTQAGETLAEIAERYGVSEARLRYDNQLAAGAGKNPAAQRGAEAAAQPETKAAPLAVGQALLVLEPERIYTVQPGDTLFGVAESQGISLGQLFRNNSWLLGEPTLAAGESLVIRYRGEPEFGLELSGYGYPFTQTAILQDAFLELRELQVFSYGFTPEGELIPPRNETAILQQAREFGLRPVLVLTPLGADGKFDSGLIRTAVENRAVQDRLLQRLEEAAEEKGYRGIDVDCEYIPVEIRDGYTALVGRIREQAAASGRTVSVALAPKTSREQKGLLYEGMDYRGLGEAADRVFLMTYEWGYTYGPPQAVAPLNKVRQVVEYARTEIPPQKMVLGLANYAYDWSLPFVKGESAALTVGNVEAARIAAENGAEIRWDGTAQSPTFTYRRAGVDHQVWFEDVRSWQAKLALAQEYGLYGAGVWNLLREFRPGWLLAGALVKRSGER